MFHCTFNWEKHFKQGAVEQKHIEILLSRRYWIVCKTDSECLHNWLIKWSITNIETPNSRDNVSYRELA